MTLLQTEAIAMQYANKRALESIDMTITSGKIIGLLGPNGSGKTTLMKIIAGLLQPSSGKIHYPGNAQKGVDSKRTISFMPDELKFPGYMTVKDTFVFSEDMYADYCASTAANLQQLLDINDMSAKIKNLSKGERERISLALTFSRKAKLYLLDEPLGGIDPIGKKKIIDAILSIQLDDASIIVSTHLVKDIERIFDQVFFISEGKIAFSGDCDEIREEGGITVEQKYLDVFSNSIERGV